MKKVTIQVKVIGYGEVYLDNDATLLELSKIVYKDDYKKYLGAKIDR